MVELAGAGLGRVLPEHAARPRRDDRRSGVRIVGEQDPVRGDQLRVGRVRDRCTERPAELSPRADVVDPGPGDLADEHAAVWQRSRAVDRPQVARRVVTADAGRAELPYDRMPPGDPDDAAVVGVRDGDQAVAQQVCVVRGVQVPGRSALHVDVAVAPQHLPTRERDDLNRVLVLLVGDDPVVARAEERVVVEVERHRGRPACRIPPQDPVSAVDEEHAIVAPVGDQQIARERRRRVEDDVRLHAAHGGGPLRARLHIGSRDA